MKEYYMTRNTVFSRSAINKMLYTMISLYLASSGEDLLKIYCISTFIWSFVEHLLQKYKVRKISPMMLGNMIVPRPYSLLLQGSQEAGFLCVYSLYFADQYPWDAECVLFFFWTLAAIYAHTIASQIFVFDTRKDMHSKRLVNDTKSMVVLGSVCLLDMHYLAYIEFWRPFKFLMIMSALGATWTSAQFSMKARNIVGKDGAFISFREKIIIFAYDVFIEIAMAYMPFYILSTWISFS